MSLAIHLGYVSRQRMFKDLSMVEYLEARELMNRWPWGSIRDGIHLGMLVRNMAILKGGRPSVDLVRKFVFEWSSRPSATAADVVEFMEQAEPITLGDSNGQ